MSFRETNCSKCNERPVDASQSFGDCCQECIIAEVEADLAAAEDAGDWPKFACPICSGTATLIDGADGYPEFCCLECPLPVELVPTNGSPFEDYRAVA